MHTPSTSPANAAAPTSILVWDAPVRVFHWLMVLCFAGAYLTAERETWRVAHATLGYTMAGLVAFRLVWGLAGTRYARFATFVRGPRAVVAYVGSMLRGQPEHHTGHNPAGALAIVAILVLTLALGVSGWAADHDMAGKWVAALHEGVATTLLAVVCVHVAGVIVASALHGENLARAMVTGRKLGAPIDAIRSTWRTLAVLMLAAVLGFWYVQWQSAPV